MPDLKSRLARLEARHGPSRTLLVFSGGASDEEVTDMLDRDHGIRPVSADQIIHFAAIYEDRDGNPVPNPAPPRYVPGSASV